MKKRILNRLSVLLLVIYFSTNAVVFGFSNLYYNQVYNNEFSLIKSRSEQQVLQVKKKITTTLDSIITDVLAMSENKGVYSYMADSSKVNEFNLLDEFLTLVKYRKEYDQIRYVGIDGMEKVRVNYNYGNPVGLSAISLQDVSNRYYFNGLRELKKGEIYISKFDLNVENGKIELPHKPAIRVGVPLFAGGEKKGFLIFNYLAEELLYSLYEAGYQDSVSYLYNSEGYLLKGLDSENEWGFMFQDKLGKTLVKEDPDLWNLISNTKEGYFEYDENLYVVSTIHPAENIVNKESCACNDWKLVNFTSASLLRDASDSVYYYLLIINISAVLIFTIIFWILIRFLFYKEVAEQKILELNDTLKVINKILRHDLSNAFTSVGLNLDVYEKELKNKEFVSSVREVITSGKNLIYHMKELEGMVSLGEEMKSIKLHEVIFNITKKYKIKFEIKGRARAHCDDAIETVFENIITNALRHGRTKKMKINIRRTKNNVKIEFIDFGKGIPNEIQKKVFEEGFKYGSAANTGLGLFIVKKTIDRYGGVINVKSNKPRGSVFTIKIPR